MNPQEVYIEYRKAMLVDKTEDKWIIEYTDKNETIRKTINYQPIPVEEAEKFPEWINIKGELFKLTLKRLSWLNNGTLNLFAEYISNRPDRFSTELLSEAIEKRCDAPEFMTTAEVEDALYEISKESTPITEKIKLLQKELQEINQKKIPVQNKCWHQWALINEESTGRNSLWVGLRKEYECGICGLSMKTYYTELK